MSDKPVTHRFRYVALGVGAVGLGLLYLSALHREIPAVRIGEIKPAMNFATVRVSGEVSRDARLFREGEHIRALRFSVSDGTGEIHVQAQRAAAQALVTRFGLPREGDRVEAVGSLDVSEGNEVVMRLQVPEQFVLQRAEIKPVALKEIDRRLLGKNIVVEGTIEKVLAPKSGSRAPWTMGIGDSGGRQEITFWQDIYDEIQNKELLAPGASVRARVEVRSYKDRLQLTLGQGLDIEFLAASAPQAEPAREMDIGSVKPSMAGRVVTVRGELGEPRSIRGGVIYPLSDGSGSILLVLWDKTVFGPVRDSLSAGRHVVVSGKVKKYKGDLEVVPDNVEAIRLATPPGR